MYKSTTALGIETYLYTSVGICEGSDVTAMQVSGAAGTVNGSKINLVPGFPTSSLSQLPLRERYLFLQEWLKG
jgi:hypothetical protein